MRKNNEDTKAYRIKWYYQNKDSAKQSMKKYYEKNKDKKLEYAKKYREEHKEEIKQYKIERNKTPIGRAENLLRTYNKKDKKYNRGEGNLTAQWIVENIFTKPCAHCGITGWDIIGCNRIDNSKPHTMDNVEPCCFKCNVKLPRKQI